MNHAPLEKHMNEPIHHLVFDLDNTLYPASSKMDAGITSRMISSVAKQVGVSIEEATRLRKERMPIYGTTLGWLRAEHNLTNVQDFFNFVHPEEEIYELDYDEKLRPFLKNLQLPMSILTNSPTIHANRVLDFFNIKDLFLFISDIETNNLQGKPYQHSYFNAVFQQSHNLSDTLFLDDLEKYTKGYTAIGGKAILVTDKLVFPGEKGTFNCDYIVKDILSNKEEKPVSKDETLFKLPEIKQVILEKNPELLPYACISSVYDLPKIINFIKS